MDINKIWMSIDINVITSIPHCMYMKIHINRALNGKRKTEKERKNQQGVSQPVKTAVPW